MKNSKKWEKRLMALFLGFMIGHILIMMVQVAKSDLTDPVNFYNYALENAEETTYIKFLEDLNTGAVDTVYYSQTNERMVYTLWTTDSKHADEVDDDTFVYGMPETRVTLYPAGEGFRKEVLLAGSSLILINETSSRDTIVWLVSGLLPVILTAGLLIWWIKKMGSPINELKSSEVLQTSDTKLDDIIGLDEAKDELKIIISLIKNTIEGNDLGAKIPHGILLSGPPGVGKTMIAKAVSNAAGVPFISMSGSDFQEIYVGTGAKHVRELFSLARKNAPCIIFIDEFDAIGTSRESASVHSEDRRTINALLKEMDGFKSLDQVFVIAATNHPETLDPAIVRSGRFDREITIRPPASWHVRKELFKHYLKDKKIAEDVNIDSLAKTLSGFTGADIAYVCNEACLVALAQNKKFIDDLCLTTAVDKKIFKGPYAKENVYEQDRVTVAYHEAGHAICRLLLGEEVSRASIKATTSGVGGAVFGADKLSQFTTKTDVLNMVKIAYAGRVAEELFMKDITIGAGNDIEKAGNLLQHYVATHGFDEEVGLVPVNGMGEYYKKLCEERVLELSKSLHNEVRKLLSSNTELIDKLAKKLLELETMSGKEISEFLEWENVNEDTIQN